MSPQSVSNAIAGLIMIGLSLPLAGGVSVKAQETTSEADAGPVPFQKIVVFDKSVHFLTPDGKDIVIQPGSYSVEVAHEGLKLKSLDNDATEAVIVQADDVTHDSPVTTPDPSLVEEGDDGLVVLLMLPDGKARQAVGSYTGIVSRHAVPIIKPGAIVSLAGQLPKINSLLATPPPPPEYASSPPGHISPLGTLYLKGDQFGSAKGKLLLIVQVPIAKNFHLGIGELTSPGSSPGYQPGTRAIQLVVTQWSQDKITAKMPLVAGVPDHTAVLQVLNAQGLGSGGWQVPFHAMRGRRTLQYKENVTKVLCSHGANRNVCLGETAIDPALTLEGPCFYSGPNVNDKTISAWHLNCHAVVDFDSGADTYTIELKNNWVVEQVRWGWTPSSTSEKLKLPSAEALTQRYRGAQKMILTVPWEVSPGPDWLAYWIDVDVKGPVGIAY